MFARREEASKEIKIGRTILNEDDLKFTVTYKGDVFVMRHLAPYERDSVELEISRRLGGMPREAHDPNHVGMVEARAYVNASIVKDEAPEWWKSADTCYDEDCIVELYRGLLNFKSEFRDRFKGDEPKGSGEGGKS